MRICLTDVAIILADYKIKNLKIFGYECVRIALEGRYTGKRVFLKLNIKCNSYNFCKSWRNDNVFEVTESKEALALKKKTRGTIYFLSTHGKVFQFNQTLAVVNEIRIQASRCGAFAGAIDLLKQGKVRVDKL